jgi:hypothetical protein
MSKIKDRIQAIALEILKAHPDGLRYSEWITEIKKQDATLEHNTVHGRVYDLVKKDHSEIYKPARGLYRLIRFRATDDGMELPTEPTSVISNSAAKRAPKESEFYQSFADWLIEEVEEVTKAKPLGGNVFGQKWGTPDVLGFHRSKEWDIVKAPMQIVTAEIKTDTSQLITAYGQACAYKLFSHKVYLVVPVTASKADLSRLDSLCLISDLGLVTFNADAPDDPDYRILARPRKHDPDLFYTNQCMESQKEFFSS